MSIIDENFMLHNRVGERLYHEYAEKLPIIDYHCHISPAMIAEDYQFKNASELFLGGDHYKWRAMRSNGIEERYITGDAGDYEKFCKWAETVPYLIGNPLLHWTQLELKRYFEVEELLSPQNAAAVWNRCNERLSGKEYSARGLIRKSNVVCICTTDDPMDDLKYHKKIREDGFDTRVYPTFRPDRAVEIDKATFLPYMEEMKVNTYQELQDKIRERIAYFHQNGCRLSDHALEYVPFSSGNAGQVFEKRMRGDALTKKETDIFKTDMLIFCAEEYQRLGWAMQLHIGALRNNNSKMYQKLGADTGFDSINDLCIAEPLAAFLDRLEQQDSLPKTILYTLNPKDNYVLGTMLGNFQKAPVPGKIQFGSGWWFNDQRDGMIAQMTSLANLGLLSRFVGMLTDSRSFVSYTRHEYFRRILCNLIGGWVEQGEYPEDYAMLKTIVNGICYDNARRYFQWEEDLC